MQIELYPEIEQLSRLHIVWDSADMVCFADHFEQILFVAIRGTNVFTARDMGNNVLIVCGKETLRSSLLQEQYCILRDKYPTYSAMGCGHSLGGAVMHEL